MDRLKEESLTPGPDDNETRSMFSMRELDPSPVEDYPPDIESGEYFPDARNQGVGGNGRFATELGLKGYRWDYWLSAIQRYSTYPSSAFVLLHAANTSLIPLVTHSISSSESFLLLTRPIYQSPSLEHVMLTIPIFAHIASGVALRSMRAGRRARLYGAETRAQRYLIKSWPIPSLQAKLGYITIPLLGLHVLVNRVVPLTIDGGSSGVGLGYVAHGFDRSPVFWNIFYIVLVGVSVWHFVGGWAAWMGWRVTTARTETSQGRFFKGGYLPIGESRDEMLKRKRIRWAVHGIAALGTALWLASGLGIVGHGGRGSGWEAKNWDQLYRNIPVIGAWL